MDSRRCVTEITVRRPAIRRRVAAIAASVWGSSAERLRPGDDAGRAQRARERDSLAVPPPKTCGLRCHLRVVARGSRMMAA